MKIAQKISPSLRQFGQGMTEYIIIVIVVAIAAIGVYMYFGKTMREDVAGMAKEMSGQSATAEIGLAKGAANAGAGIAKDDKGLGSYETADPAKK